MHKYPDIIGTGMLVGKHLMPYLGSANMLSAELAGVAG